MNKENGNPVEGWVTLNEAGQIVNRDMSTIRYWADKGKIRSYHIGSSAIRIVNVEEVLAYSEKAARLVFANRANKKRRRRGDS